MPLLRDINNAINLIHWSLCYSYQLVRHYLNKIFEVITKKNLIIN